jgi:voltage-gated sodium channel
MIEIVQEHDGMSLTRAWVLTEKPRFERLVSLMIALNTILLVADLFVMGHEAVFEIMDYAILTFFVSEVLIKLAAVRWDVRVFLNKKWNVFDVVVIALSLLPFLGNGALMLRMARMARVLHSTRHVKHIRIAGLLARRFGR